jgi:hypothetical protein
VPYSVDEPAIAEWRDYVNRVGSALAADRRDEALELFMSLAGGIQSGHRAGAHRTVLAGSTPPRAHAGL